MSKPTLAVVSMDIRRDLILPMRDFSKFRLVHLYRNAPYGDMTPDEMDPSLVEFQTPCGLFRHLWKAKPDLVQGVEPFLFRLLPYQYAIFGYAVVRRIPLVLVTFENRPLSEKYGRMLARLQEWLLWPIFRYAKSVVALNKGAERNVSAVTSNANVTRLMYGTWGVDLDEFSPCGDIDEHMSDSDAENVILFVGRIHREKGIFQLLQAFARVRRRMPSTHLILIGDGPKRSMIENLIAAEDLQDCVTILGTIENRKLPPYFRGATVFVAPSITTRRWEEQVGMTNIQAMACGTPVVSTRSGAIPEYVPDGEAGILVPERDPVALADAILLLLTQDALRQRMGEYGRAYAVEHYDAGKNVRIAEEYLVDLLGSTAS